VLGKNSTPFSSTNDAQTIIARLSNFPHIDSFRIFRKSFMTSLSIVLKDGQVLSIDLIWKLKRRATVFAIIAKRSLGPELQIER